MTLRRGVIRIFSPIEYRTAIANANLILKKELKYYDSVINYFPKREIEIRNMHKCRVDKARQYLSSKFGILSFLLTKIYCWKNGINVSSTYSESKVPGRMYTYVAIKK